MDIQSFETSIGITFNTQNFKIEKDCLIQLSENEAMNVCFHIDHLKILKKTDQSNKELTLSYCEENITLNFVDKKTYELFNLYFNFLRTAYLLNIKYLKLSSDHLSQQDFLNYNINIKNYTNKGLLHKMFSSITENSDIINTKMNDIVKNLHTMKENAEKLGQNNSNFPIIMLACNKIFNELKCVLIPIYKENLLFLQDKAKNPINRLTDLSCEVVVNNYDYIQQTNLNLQKILLEMTKRFYFEIVKFYDTNNILNSEYRNVIKDYFYGDEKFSLSEDLKGQLNEQSLKMMALKEKKEFLEKESKRIKKSLREITYDRNIFILFCFKCGNILKRTLKKASNCKIDSKCTNFSYNLCLKCKINYCTYCIKEVKEGKCGKGHLMFKFGEIENKNCINCSIIIENEGYVCSLCNIDICIFCFDVMNNNMNYKCEYCKCQLLWRRSNLTFCDKCNEFSQTFWECFYCEINYCAKCHFLKLDFCGAFHMLENINLDSLKNKDFLYNVNKSNNETYQILHIMNFSCSFCKRITLPTFRVCRRCHFQICAHCLLYMDN